MCAKEYMCISPYVCKDCSEENVPRRQQQEPETDNSPAFPSSASCRSCPGCYLDLHPLLLLLLLPAALCLWVRGKTNKSSVRVKTNNSSVENVTVVTKATGETMTTQWSLC